MKKTGIFFLNQSALTVIMWAVCCMYGYAQCNFSYEPDGEICSSSTYLCGDKINGYKGKLRENLSKAQPWLGMCNGIGSPDNVSWFSFTACSNKVTIEITVKSCYGYDLAQKKSLGSHPNAGLQAGLYSKCERGKWLDCSKNPLNPPGLTGTFIISSDKFVPGSLGYFYIDGFSLNKDQISVCEFTLKVIEGIDTTAIIPPNQNSLAKGQINGPNTISCNSLNKPLTFTLKEPERKVNFNNSCVPPSDFNPQDSICYFWSVSPSTGRYFKNQDSTGLDSDIVFTQPGTYTISANTYFNPTYVGNCGNAVVGEIINFKINISAHPDYAPLMALYNSTNGPAWTNNTGWKEGAAGSSCDPCNFNGQPWYGIQCTNGRVTCIDLDGNANCNYNNIGNNLVGTIPDSLKYLSHVTALFLSNNNLNGIIPPAIDSLKNLIYLRLSDNRLSGSIPSLNLPNLMDLSLSNNQLSGKLPVFNLPSLIQLGLYLNQLSDTIPNFGLCKNIEFLSLGYNRFTGPIPNFNLPKLAQLWLNNNQLKGDVPNFNLPNLVVLSLAHNKLDGNVPAFNLPKLQGFHINNNAIKNITNLTYITTWINPVNSPGRVLLLQRNLLTFKDILPNMSIFVQFPSMSSYSPQDSIYRDTTFTRKEGESLTIDLGIDAGITTNVYQWYQNETLRQTINGVNKLTFTNIKQSDAGVWTCRVTNPGAAALTLQSRRISINVQTSCRSRDSLALVDFYTQAGGPNWTNKWDLAKPMTTWYGISLSPEGCVECIDLDGEADCKVSTYIGNNLVGTISSKIDTMLDLKFLILSSNKLSGEMPVLEKNINLTIFSCAGNMLTGQISNISKNIGLKEFWCRNNELTGSLPDLSNNNLLENFQSSYNNITGEIPDLSKNVNLKVFNSQGTQLSGKIPNLNNNLNLLWFLVSSNKLIGTIPNISKNTKLQWFLCDGNQLEGEIPDLSKNLDLINFSFNINKLTGTIPDLSKNVNLQQFLCNGNQLTGDIPDLSKNVNLIRLRFDSNKLTGTIPDLSKNVKLEYFQCHNNKIDSIPKLTINNLKRDTTFQRGLRVFGNRVTFDDILPNIQYATTATFIYTPQDSIYRDTTFTRKEGESLTIDLGIDAAIITNVYKWYKNGVLVDSITGSNKRTFTSIKQSDDGVWTCRVTNPGAPLLTLQSRKITINVQPSCRLRDSLALVDFWEKAGGPNWTNKWDLTKPMSTWYGIRLSAEGCVECIDLGGRGDCSIFSDHGNNLVGFISSRIDSLSQLKIIKLGFNKLTGSIPDLSNNVNLQLFDVWGNKLTGKFPVLKNLLKLSFFQAGLNQIVDSFPDISNNRELQTFYIPFTEVSGALPDFSLFPKLEWFSVSNCKISGNIPSLSKNRNLSHFSVSGNKLTGKLPDLSSNVNLTIFEGSDNQFTGNFPVLSNNIKLNFFDCSLNQLNGSIPDLSKNINLRDFRCDRNILTGSIPDLSNNTKLELFWCENNKIDSIPKLTIVNLKRDTSNQIRGLRVFNNHVTFDDILPNIQYATTATFVYAPQDSIYRDTAFTRKEGESLTIDLGIDATISTNVYKWYKNGALVDSITGSNKRTFTSIKQSDAGVWTCRVTNPGAPLLTLLSRKITINVQASCRVRDSLALVDFWEKAGGPNWRNKWDLTKPMNTWVGISLNADGCVVTINFPWQLVNNVPQGNNLNGIISPMISTLSELKILSCQVNQLKGTIPDLSKNLNLQVFNCWRNELTGSIPDLSLNLNLTNFDCSLNQLSGTIPDLSKNLKLRSFWCWTNKLIGLIPDLSKNVNLTHFDCFWNQISGTIPNLSNNVNLTRFNCAYNQLSGTIPDLSKNIKLESFQCDNNRIEAIPKLTLQGIKKDSIVSNGLRVFSNRVTFDDILPNIGYATTATFIYSPQDSIYRDTAFTRKEGESLTIDLGIDATITTNVYKWYKNGALIDSITGSNKRTFSSIKQSDAGIWTVRVTNPGAPLLTLQSRKITINVQSSCRQRDSIALVSLRNTTNGNNWKNLWNVSTPIHQWYGVTLNSEG